MKSNIRHFLILALASVFGPAQAQYLNQDRNGPLLQAPIVKGFTVTRIGNDLSVTRTYANDEKQTVVYRNVCLDPAKVARKDVLCEDLWAPIIATR